MDSKETVQRLILVEWKKIVRVTLVLQIFSRITQLLFSDRFDMNIKLANRFPKGKGEATLPTILLFWFCYRLAAVFALNSLHNVLIRNDFLKILPQRLVKFINIPDWCCFLQVMSLLVSLSLMDITIFVKTIEGYRTTDLFTLVIITSRVHFRSLLLKHVLLIGLSVEVKEHNQKHSGVANNDVDKPMRKVTIEVKR